MIFLRFNFLACIICVLVGCTTATYGRQFVPISGAEHQYKMVVATGGFAGKDVATKRLEEKEIPRFLKEHPEYKSYEIISKEFKLIPSGVTFIVRFFRE